MKKSRYVVDSRREQILELIKTSGNITVSELAKKFDVSLLTIRRDLQYLEDEHFLERFYGGARIGAESSGRSIDKEVERCKDKIAQYAATLVEDGDSIFINTSSTALRMLHYIASQNVTVITNNGNVINMEQPPNITVVLAGGELRYMKGAMVGEFALSNISKVTAKKTFVGCSGLSPENGMTTELLNEVNINQAMISRVTDCSYILADHTKIGRNSSFVSCPAEEITNIITDSHVQEPVLQEFKEKGIRVHQVLS